MFPGGNKQQSVRQREKEKNPRPEYSPGDDSEERGNMTNRETVIFKVTGAWTTRRTW